MAQAFNPEVLRDEVDRLAVQGRLAFLLSCAERLAPNYTVFARHHNWGEPGALRQALDLGWRCLSGAKADPQEIRILLADCEAATPDTEDFESEYVSSGLDAAVCCAFVLELLIKDDSAKVVEGLSLARDTVDMHVQELESMHPQDPELEDKILRHPLMQQELRRQHRDLGLVGQLSFAEEEAVLQFRRRSQRERTLALDRASDR